MFDDSVYLAFHDIIIQRKIGVVEHLGTTQSAVISKRELHLLLLVNAFYIQYLVLS